MGFSFRARYLPRTNNPNRFPALREHDSQQAPPAGEPEEDEPFFVVGVSRVLDDPS